MFLILGLIFTIGSAFARPSYLEVWFVAEEEVTSTDLKIPLKLGQMIAEKSEKKCRPIDKNSCFHPQHGVISIKDGKEISLEDDKTIIPGPKASDLSEADLIRCQKSYHFDLFCGEAAKLKRNKVNLEIWIDTSSSMRAYDFAPNLDFCKRKSLIKLLRSKCNESKFELSVFAGSLKSNAKDDYLCFNTGVNDQDRLISWIDASVAKNLIVVTDTSQLTLKMTTYLKSIGAVIRGMDKSDTIFVGKLPDMVKHAVPFCK